MNFRARACCYRNYAAPCIRRSYPSLAMLLCQVSIAVHHLTIVFVLGQLQITMHLLHVVCFLMSLHNQLDVIKLFLKLVVLEGSNSTLKTRSGPALNFYSVYFGLYSGKSHAFSQLIGVRSYNSF